MRVTWLTLARALLFGGPILLMSCDSPPASIDSGPGVDSGPEVLDSGADGGERQDAGTDAGMGEIDGGDIDGGDIDGGMTECTAIFDTSVFDSSCFGD